ncbi:hypothetical protein J14TS2_24160 [Bacillus sp. J14TS2]|uniref:SLAP domain-containing protein n=1 Tax=Bacillus sp. J14TS2 TaxID=2807188 RepID=UPI001B0FDDA7|nr:SLAP domain-containing protein [Bacillus sp. J14TS2]GIN71941.1 hypothetical protein J14TS2_24160 [Bacillus sp. J14TS2]
MSAIHFHPVWDQQLTEKEKESYIQEAQTLVIPEESFTVSPIMTKYKRNGGLVATVFLHNGFPYPLHLHKLSVRITNQHKETIAQGDFSSSLEINPMSSQPWSFVFSKQMVNLTNADLTYIAIAVSEDV